MKNLYTATACLLVISVAAQPTITEDNIPQIGDISTIGICSDIVDAGALASSAGAMQTWDFSNLSEIAEEEFHFVPPDDTPWPGTFIGSDMCGVSWDNAYSYYAVNAGYLETIGQALILPGLPPEDTMKLLYTLDTERVVPLPYTYGDDFADTFSGTITVGAFQGTVDGTVDFEADGYGTLILPNGTYANVVRYHITRVQNNAISGFPPNTISKEQWAWVSSDHRFWLLLMELIDDGFGADESIVWYDKSPLPAGPAAIGEEDLSTFQLHPNPVSAGDPVTMSNIGTTALAWIEVCDATGRVIRIERPVDQVLSTAGLNPGIYLIGPVDVNGRRLGIQRLVIH